MRLFFAPLQGYTDFVYREIHNEAVGCVDGYFMPFLRWDGGTRNRDIRDILPENNDGVPVVPQVIAADCDELKSLLDVVEECGYSHVDLNMGCPFPLQTGRGRGAALLSCPDKVQAMMEELSSRELHFSVKMRSGMTELDEGLTIIDLLNDYDLDFITIHPRFGIQQYKGDVDMDAFAMMAEKSRHGIVYNGDMTTVEKMHETEHRFPDLYGWTWSVGETHVVERMA